MPILGRMCTERSPVSIAPTQEDGVMRYVASSPATGSIASEGTASRRLSRWATESVYGLLCSYSRRSSLRITRRFSVDRVVVAIVRVSI